MAHARGVLPVDTYVKYEEMVKGPGKFEREPSYVPRFWEDTLAGMCDDEVIDKPSDETVKYLFRVSPGDVREWPDLANVGALLLWEDNNGFVHSDRLTIPDVRRRFKLRW
jgi:hypothetical protein